METDSQMDVLIYALLESASDKQDEVKQAVSKSLCKLGAKRPEFMLTIAQRYLDKHGKLSTVHRTLILGVMAEVCRSSLTEIGPTLAKELIKFAIEEMVVSKDIIPTWQGGASSILVALGNRYCYEVMEFMHVKFQPGIVPHFFVVQTLGDLAAANAFGMVPFLKAILQTTLTIIGLVKHDNIKWVFAHGLARFSEAISEYLANIEKAPDTSVKKEVFSTELTVAYSTLFNTWLQSKESKVRFAVVDAIGQITRLLPRDKLDEELCRLIPGLLGLYRRHPETPLFVTQGLSLVLDAAVNNGCTSLETQLENILNCLFPQICTIPDYTQPMVVKNYNEVLRCFAVIARAYSERIVTYLLQRVDNNNERIRIGSFAVLRHLVNSSESHISNKIATILSGLKSVLHENNNKVKKVLAQVIVALAHHGYLELDSSQSMVEFIIRQCALPDDPKGRKSPDPDYVSNEDLRSMCENILHLLTTTVDRMSTVFWPHVLEFIIPEHLTNAVGVVCKSATYLASKQKEEQSTNFEIDFEKNKSLPSPVQLIARFFVILGAPLVRNRRGLHVLSLMKVLVPALQKNLVAAWDAEIPKLNRYMEDSLKDSCKWSQKEWEESVLKLLADSLSEVDRQDWTMSLGKAFSEQMQLYITRPNEKNFLFKCIGVVLKKTSSKTLVNELLDEVIKNVNHSVASDREGCAAALGFCAASHMDAVLIKLDQTAHVDYGKKSGIFSFIMDIKGELDHEMWKATICLCYGYVAAYSTPGLLTARIESPILRNVNAYFSQASKDVTIKISLIRMTEMMAKALHPANLRERLPFRSKMDLLKHMKIFLTAEKVVGQSKTPTCALAMDACTALLKLDPVLHWDERAPLLRACYESVFPLPPNSSTLQKPEYLMTNKDNHIDDDAEAEEYDALLQTTLDSLESLLKELLLQDVTAANFYSLFASIDMWIMSVHTVERQRAIHSILILSKCFIENLNLGVSVASSSFETHGSMMARLVPRCTDPDPVVRELAMETICLVLKACLQLDGFSETHVDADIDALQMLKLQSAATDVDPSVLYNVSNELAKVLSNKLSLSQLRQFLDVLMEGLTDAQAHSSSGTCVVLNNVLKMKSGVLQQELETLIQLLHSRLIDISCLQTRKGTLQIIRTLAGSQLSMVVTSLLSYPLPFDRHVVDLWRTLAMDSQLCISITEQFCEILLRSPSYSEHPDPRNKKATVRIANPKTLSVVCALREMLEIPEMESTAQKEFERLFVSFLVMVSSYIDVFPPSVMQESAITKDSSKSAKTLIVIQTSGSATGRVVPSRMAMETLQALLVCTRCTAVFNDLINSWDLLDGKETNATVVACFAKSIAEHYQRYLPGMIAFLNPMLASPCDSQRIVAVAFFAELIYHRKYLDQSALELLLNSMLGRLVDSSHIVRRLAIRGLGSIGKLDVENMDTLEWFGVYKYSNTVLSAMLGGMDDKDDVDGSITLEAMNGLCKVLAEMDEKHVEGALINIVLRVRSCFENERAEIRVAAFNLFAALARFGTGSMEDSFREQLHSNLISLLVHLNDDDKEVVKACKNALRSTGPLLGSETVSKMFQQHLIDTSQLYYSEFVADLSKNMAVDFVDRMSLYIANCVAYFKSEWATVKGNAANLAGCLLASVRVELHSTISNQSVFGALTMLLKDESVHVRIKAADAISLLHAY